MIFPRQGTLPIGKKRNEQKVTPPRRGRLRFASNPFPSNAGFKNDPPLSLLCSTKIRKCDIAFIARLETKFHAGNELESNERKLCLFSCIVSYRRNASMGSFHVRFSEPFLPSGDSQHVRRTVLPCPFILRANLNLFFQTRKLYDLDTLTFLELLIYNDLQTFNVEYYDRMI